MIHNAVAHFPCEVQSLAVVFEFFHDAQALYVVFEPAGQKLIEHFLTGMTERCVSEIVSHRDRLGQVFIEPQRACDRARDLRNLQRMREARAVMIAFGRQENLCFVL